MHAGVCFNGVSVRRLVAALVSTLSLAVVPAGAQTLKLTDGADTTLRGGSYASTNFGSSAKIETRASSDDEYKRRILLKFDTHTTIAAGSSIASAKLTLTVRGGNSETRTLTAYREPQSYTESAATWKKRKSSYYWSQAGGDRAERIGQATVTGVAGSTVSYDVTSILQKIVSGTLGSSRYLRVLIVDEGSSSRGSFKEFHSNEAGNGLGPVLAVTLGSAPAPAPSEPIPTTSSTLKVLHWNVHHGVGTDGRYDLDRIATWMAKINPDVISLNEVEYYTGYGNENQPRRFAELMKAKTGRTWYYHFATYNGATNAQGNMVMSRFPLESKGSYLLSYQRVVTQGTLTVNGRTINVFSTHLDDASSSERATQMSQLKSWASGFAQQRILAGDFNTYPSQGEITRMTSSYYDAWATASSMGTAVGDNGNTKGATRNNRIDYVFYSTGATALVLKSARVYETADGNGVKPSDHRPLLVTYSVK